MVARKPARKYRIYINEQLVGDARLLEINRKVSPQFIDTARFEYSPRPYLANVGIKSRFTNSICRIEIDLSAYGGYTVVHQGYIAGGDIGYSQEGNKYIVNSRLDPFMFGDPLDSAAYGLRPASSPTLNNWSSQVIDGPTHFNPVYDGRVQGNMLSILPDKSDLAFYDIDSLPEGFTHNQKWSLREAAFYLINLMNPTELHVQNPLYADLSHVSNDPDILVDLTIPRGVYLPEALRILLEPFGYLMITKYSQASNLPQLFIRRRDTNSTPAVLLGTAIGQPATLNSAPIPRIDVKYEQMRDSATEVTVIGDYEVKESTFELVPGWDQSFDTKMDEPLDLRLDSDYVQTTPGAEFAWRRWVLNEAGDHNDNGRSLSRWDASTLFTLTPIIHKRRKFMPVLANHLSGGVAGPHDGVLIEWYHPEKGEWFSIHGSEPTVNEHHGLKYGTSVRLLERECGIMFTGALPPVQMMQYGIVGAPGEELPKSKIRITASIRGDQRIRATSAGGSPMLVTKPQVIKMDRFKWRAIDSNSEYKASVDLNLLGSSEIDNRTDLQTIADELSGAWGHANISGEIELAGVDYDHENLMGVPLSEISGREIYFGVDTAQAKFPTIVGWRTDYQNQTSTIELGTIRGRTS